LSHKEAAATAGGWCVDRTGINRNKQKQIFISGAGGHHCLVMGNYVTWRLFSYFGFALFCIFKHITPLILCSSPTYLSVLLLKFQSF